MVEFFGRWPNTTCWHVLWDGDTVGYISQGSRGWGFVRSLGALEALLPKAQAEIAAAAKEKITLLNITRRLTS